MKKLVYNLDERNILIRAMWNSNREHSLEHIINVVDSCFQSKEFKKYTLTVTLDNGTYAQVYKDADTGEIITHRQKIPYDVKRIGHRLIDKLYINC